MCWKNEWRFYEFQVNKLALLCYTIIYNIIVNKQFFNVTVM